MLFVVFHPLTPHLVLKVDQFLKPWFTHRVAHSNFERAVAVQEKLHLTVCSEIEFARTEVSGLVAQRPDVISLVSVIQEL